MLDKDGNSVKDADGNSVEPYVTKEDGQFKFCNLKSGVYKIKVTPPYGYKITKANAGDDDEDSDINVNGESDYIDLSSGDKLTTFAGFYKVPEICLGDYVWFDENLNGIQDRDEPGVVDIPVTLTYADGSAVRDLNGDIVKTIKTDKYGKYSFCRLEGAKDYKIKIEVPETYHVTLINKGSDASDSDADNNGIIDVTKTLGSAPIENVNSLDMGIYCDCDDYKIHPENHRELKMPALNLLGLLAMVSALYFIIVARRKEE